MKKASLIFVCVLLSVFCFSSLSYSENDSEKLWKYQNRVFDNYEKLTGNTKDFFNTTMTQSNAMNKYHTTLISTQQIIGDYMMWSYDIIVFFGMTHTDKHNANDMIISRLILIREILKRKLTVGIGMLYSSVKVTSLLYILDKQRDIIRSSLDTLDKTIELMKKMNRK